MSRTPATPSSSTRQLSTNVAASSGRRRRRERARRAPSAELGGRGDGSAVDHEARALRARAPRVLRSLREVRGGLRRLGRGVVALDDLDDAAARTKCKPTTWSGRSVISPISVIESPEVVEARIAWPGVAASSSAKTRCLTLEPLRHRLDHEVDVAEAVVGRRAGDQADDPLDLGAGRLLGELALGDELGRRLLDSTSRACASPASTSVSSASLSRTGMPAAAIAWASSPPMAPAPTTAALNTNMPADPSDRARPRARRRSAAATARSDVPRAGAAATSGAPARAAPWCSSVELDRDPRARRRRSRSGRAGRRAPARPRTSSVWPSPAV